MLRRGVKPGQWRLFQRAVKEGRASRYVYPHDEPQRALYDGIINVMLGAETIDDVLANMDKVTGFK